MPGDEKEQQQTDQEKIDTTNFPSLWLLAKRLGVTQDQLRVAIREVGPLVRDVKKFLGK